VSESVDNLLNYKFFFFFLIPLSERLNPVVITTLL